MQMIKKATFLKYFFVTSLIFFGCKKDTPQFSNEQQQQNAINEVRKIVGDKGSFVVHSNSFYLNENSTNIKSEFSIDSTTTRYMSVGEFKQLYESIGKYQFERILDKDSNASMKTMDFDDNPGKPGLHRVKYFSFPLSAVNGTYGINTSTTQFTVLNLWFETNRQGRVIGTPIIFYSGVTFVQNWTQLYVTEIQYNTSNNTSTFTIAGSTLYGINIFGQNIGWTGQGGFNISVNMSPSFGDDGDIRILGWK
jgi:hypothetical protein